MDFSTMSGKGVKEYIEGLSKEEQVAAINELLQDERKVIQQLVAKYERQWKKEREEVARVEGMWAIEDELTNQGFLHIAGIDEAGRGPLAGPVTAAAVILPRDANLPGINDSKKLTHKQREVLFDQIKEQALAWMIIEKDNKVIDEINILQATRHGMLDALNGLGIQADYALVDGPANPLIGLPQQGVIKGDSKSISIAAASILAKVHRDRIMDHLDEEYPQYGFKVHKGYPTASHIEAVQEHGPSPVHRMTFRPLNEM